MPFSLTEKQDAFLFSEGSRINMLSGSVRSGKTYVSILKWGLWVASQPKDYPFIMVGKTITSLKRNCFGYMVELFGSGNFQYSTTNKTAKLFGRTVYLEGANDERSEQKIRGMTLAGAYCDEVTLFPESFFTMLLSRLSVKGAKLWATCNPDTPTHYIKKDYIDKTGLDISVWNFILTDNTFLDESYIENIKKEYTGVFYNRFILGQWVRAEGIIYSTYANNVDEYYLPDDYDFKQISQISIGVDFGGNMSGTTFVCSGFTRGYKDVIILEAEKHEDGIDPEELDRRFARFVELCTKKYSQACKSWCDSAEQILIRGLRNTVLDHGLQTIVSNARKMPIIDRIMLVNKLINQGRFKVARHCKTVVNALCDAVWDDKKENERLDDFTSDIDTLDALEYSIEPHYRELMDYRV